MATFTDSSPKPSNFCLIPIITSEDLVLCFDQGFDAKLIDVNRTCKVTKGGQVIKYTAMLTCGNYHGVVGFTKAKGLAVPIALQKMLGFRSLQWVTIVVLAAPTIAAALIIHLPWTM
ncbi:hypothetical protein NE237_000140 [Protea cynaroides]|uniref:S5 DRBM domain-containing protein n=1 Tax=Protea cynaroides TaxID=273540 RepID=A0A9Q0GKS1_9MAGN|nr:hypothetical protein NE237_000140 [Protea cynaroides]